MVNDNNVIKIPWNEIKDAHQLVNQLKLSQFQLKQLLWYTINLLMQLKESVGKLLTS